MNLKEELNRLDNKAIDNDTIFYDLRDLFEAVNPSLTDDDKLKLEALINEEKVEDIADILSDKLVNECEAVPIIEGTDMPGDPFIQQLSFDVYMPSEEVAAFIKESIERVLYECGYELLGSATNTWTLDEYGYEE